MAGTNKNKNSNIFNDKTQSPSKRSPEKSATISRGSGLKPATPLRDVSSATDNMLDPGSAESNVGMKIDTTSEVLPVPAVPQAQSLPDPPHDPLGAPQAPFVLKTCLPAPGHVLKVLGRTTLPPAFFPGYTNERQQPSREEPTEDQTPAYARPSMAHWFRSPAMDTGPENIAYSVRPPLTPARPAKSRPLNDRRSFVPALGTKDKAPSTPGETEAGEPHVPVGVEQLIATEGVLEAASPCQRPNIETESTETLTSAASERTEDADAGRPSKGVLSLPAVPKAYHVPAVKDIEHVLALSHSPFEEKDHDLLGATTQSPDQEPVVWFYREPIAPIDFDFSDDEEDDVVDEAGGSSKQDSSRSSPVSRGTSVSSHPSNKTENAKLDNVIGKPSARDMMGQSNIGPDTIVSKVELAREWILCIAAEAIEKRSGTPPVSRLWDFYVPLSDEDRALKLQLQPCAKLRKVSLCDFLEKSEFDEDGLTTASKITAVLREVAEHSMGLL